MTRFIITDRAASFLREDFAADKEGRTVLAIVWQGPEAELSRGPKGEAAWTRGMPGHWRVQRMRPDELEGTPVVEVSGFSVVTIWPEKQAPNSELVIDFANGQLLVI